MIRKFLTFGALAIFVFWLVSDPSSAGTAVHSVATGLSAAGKSLGSFIKSL